MTKQVVVVDYGIGNVFSVCNALSRIGASPILSGDPVVIAKAERVILPGVGAFSKAMENLRSQGLDDAIATFIDTGRPFLGICIGMQVLMERSTEFGDHAGLGHIKGSVERIPNVSSSGSRVKVPHIGWAKVTNKSSSLNNAASCIPNDQRYFYFVHSFMCSPTSEDNLFATANYHGNKITAIVGRDNILGVQFHPERSGNVGLSFLNHYFK
jgi:glutamine amidotransferase